MPLRSELGESVARVTASEVCSWWSSFDDAMQLTRYVCGACKKQFCIPRMAVLFCGHDPEQMDAVVASHMGQCPVQNEQDWRPTEATPEDFYAS